MTSTRLRDREMSTAGKPAARRSLLLLWWAPISVIVGFVAASWLLSATWPIWQVVPLVVLLATPFGIGAYHGWRAIRMGEPRGWIGFVLHLALLSVAVIMPIVEMLD